MAWDSNRREYCRSPVALTYGSQFVLLEPFRENPAPLLCDSNSYSCQQESGLPGYSFFPLRLTGLPVTPSPTMISPWWLVLSLFTFQLHLRNLDVKNRMCISSGEGELMPHPFLFKLYLCWCSLMQS